MNQDYAIDLGICRFEAGGIFEPGPGWARALCNLCELVVVERALDDPAMHDLSADACRARIWEEDYPKILAHYLEKHPDVVLGLN